MLILLILLHPGCGIGTPIEGVPGLLRPFNVRVVRWPRDQSFNMCHPCFTMTILDIQFTVVRHVLLLSKCFMSLVVGTLSLGEMKKINNIFQNYSYALIIHTK